MQRTNGRGVAQAFADMQDAVNSNGQFYTDGRVIYSYGQHWPIAAWIKGELHLNDDRYGTTTSKHRSFVIGGLVRVGGGSAKLETAIHHNKVADMIAVCRDAGLMS